jgi:hypothetical protein
MALWKTVLNMTQLNFNYESQIRGHVTASTRWIYASPIWPLLLSALHLVWRRTTNFILRPRSSRSYYSPKPHRQTASTCTAEPITGKTRAATKTLRIQTLNHLAATQSSLAEGYQHFGSIWCRHLQGRT